MLRKLSALLFSLMLVTGLAACGGGDEEGSDSSGGDNSGGGESMKVDADAAEATFKQNCASCHGQNLEGGNGPNLQHVGKEHSKKEILNQIKNGGGGMPANVIEGEEAENVAAWLASKK